MVHFWVKYDLWESYHPSEMMFHLRNQQYMAGCFSNLLGKKMFPVMWCDIPESIITSPILLPKGVQSGFRFGYFAISVYKKNSYHIKTISTLVLFDLVYIPSSFSLLCFIPNNHKYIYHLNSEFYIIWQDIKFNKT